MANSTGCADGTRGSPSYLQDAEDLWEGVRRRVDGAEQTEDVVGRSVREHLKVVWRVLSRHNRPLIGVTTVCWIVDIWR